MRQRIHQKIFLITCLLLAFFLPVFPRLLPSIIVIMAANWLTSGIYLKTVPQIFKERWRLLTLSFASLYLFYVVGMLYSTDFAYGWFDLEVKLSLLAFPVIFGLSDLRIFNYERTRLLFGSFLAGCFAGSLILLFHALIANERWGVPDAFYYTNLSWYIHPSYLAMYYTFGIGIALASMAGDFTSQPAYKTIILSVIMLYLEGFLFLLSSKAGLMMLIITQVLFVLLLIYQKVGLTRIVLVSAIMAIAFFGFSRTFPYAFTRISKADSMITSAHSVKSNPNDGTVARMEIWKVSIGLIRQNFLFGVGTGDVKDVLLEAYKTQHLNPLYKKKLNAHNQYLQTWIALGIFGFHLLILLFLTPALRALKKGDYLYFLFITIFAVNIMFESMLEGQAGVVFYAFFNAFLFSKCFGSPLIPDASHR